MGFLVQRRDPTEPAQNAAAVTPHDTNELTNWSRGLYVGTTGNIVVYFIDSSTSVTLSNVPVGFYPWGVKRVLATGTTASNIVAMW